MSDRSDRFDAALRDLGERYAQGAFICKGDIAIVAARHSSTTQERDVLVAWLSMQVADL
jgi:hypothetical protein